MDREEGSLDLGNRDLYPFTEDLCHRECKEVCAREEAGRCDQLVEQRPGALAKEGGMGTLVLSIFSGRESQGLCPV